MGFFFAATLGVGIVPAAGLGLPLGAQLVRALRRVRSRRWHVLAVLTLGASLGALGALALPLEGSWVFVPAVGLAALTGWWVVHRRLARASESCTATSRAAGE